MVSYVQKEIFDLEEGPYRDSTSPQYRGAPKAGLKVEVRTPQECGSGYCEGTAPSPLLEWKDPDEDRTDKRVDKSHPCGTCGRRGEIPLL